MTKALVFDMDGLLLDSERIVKRSWEEIGIRIGIPDLGENIYHTLGINRKARDAYFLGKYGEGFPLEEFNRGTGEVFCRIVQEEGLPVKAGAKELLAYARREGLKTAVATSSGRAYAVRELEAAGIWRYFDGGVFGDMIRHAKPDPEIYLKACESLDIPPEECIALEDSPNGIRSAHAAGLRVIVIPDLVEPAPELMKLVYRRLDSLHDVIDLLEKNE